MGWYWKQAISSWKFAEIACFQYHTRHWQQSSEIIIDISQCPNNYQLESLYQCIMQIEDTKETFFLKYSKPYMLDQELATYDTLIWSDGSLRVEDQIGSAGHVWNNYLGEILGELGENFYPIFSSFQAETLALMCALKNCFMYDENVTDKSICILSDSQGLLRHLKSYN